jgi:putative transposase
MKTAYKFRFYPTRQQEAILDLTLETCRRLYNIALADRKKAYEVEGISRTYEAQAAMLTAERKNGNYQGIYAHSLQDVLRRLGQLPRPKGRGLCLSKKSRTRLAG